MLHHWSFNEPYPYKDHITGQEVKFVGDTEPLNTTDYLSLTGASCLILGSFKDGCLSNMTACNSGFSLAFWLQVKPSATSPQVLVGTTRNGTDIHGVFVYQTQAIRTERRLFAEVYVNGFSWKVPLTVSLEMWVFIALSWNNRVGSLSVYMNRNRINSTRGGYESDPELRRLLKLRGRFPRHDVPATLYLESGGLYDEVMTWSSALDYSEMKRLFQSQLSKQTYMCGIPVLVRKSILYILASDAI